MVSFQWALSTTPFKVAWHKVTMLGTKASPFPSALVTVSMDKKVHLKHLELALATNLVLLNHTSLAK